jgi:hypothetical protein
MFIRVTEAGKPGFQLRKGEQGISVFDTEAVEPALTDSEVLEPFRAGSRLVMRSREEIESKGLTIVLVLGSESLPMRLREAHAEIRRGPEMSREKFKKALQELE